MSAPLRRTYTAVIPNSAAGADFVVTVCSAPWDGSLVSAVYYPDTNITGADTNSRTYNVHNRGDDGDGTTLMASIAMEAGTDGAQYAAVELAVASGEDAEDAECVAGDVITFESLHIGGTGLADPGGTIAITLERA